MSAITSKGKRAFTLIELSDLDRKRARGSGNHALLKIMKDRQEERNQVHVQKLFCILVYLMT